MPRVMILAAGRGERMRPLTDVCPKPLLEAGGKPLIVHHIERLARAGLTDIVINTAWLGHMIEARLGDGSKWGVSIQYSHEADPLETAGGIAHARDLLGDAPFLLINGDVYTDWDVAQAQTIAASLDARNADMWLLLVDNPPHHTRGDFSIDAHGRVHDGGPGARTYAGVAIYQPQVFKALDPNRAAPLAPLLRQSMAAGRVIGQHYTGQWADIGTAERLSALDQALAISLTAKPSKL